MVTVAVIALLFVPDVDIRIREDQVRDALDERIPLSHDVGFAVVDLRRADIRFLDDRDTGAVGIQARIEVDSFGLGGKGSADIVSRLRYDRGAFYLTDLQLDDFEVTPSAATRLKLLAWKKAVETFLDELGEDIRDAEGEAAFEAFLKNRETLGPLLRTALDDALKDVPVYRLDGSVAQTAVWMALKDVRFEDRVAIATLSPARAIMILAACILGVMIVGLWLWSAWLDRRQPEFE